MKVFEVKSEWEKATHPNNPSFNRRIADIHRMMLYKRNTLLFDRIEQLMKKHPGDILVAAFPSVYDDDYDPTASGVPGTPEVVEKHPNDYETFKVYDPVFFQDDMRRGEPYDDAHEMWYVKKSKPQLVNFIKQALRQFQMNDRYLHHLNKVCSGIESNFDPIIPRNRWLGK